MRLDFKRIMSSVLAFVMLFSSLVMVNVVSVSAETTTSIFIADNYPTAAKNTEFTGVFNFKLSSKMQTSDTPVGEGKYTHYVKAASSDVINIMVEGDAELTVVSNTTGKSPIVDGVVLADQRFSADKNYKETFTLKSKEDNKHTLQFKDGSGSIFYMEVKQTGSVKPPTPTTITWTVDKSGVTGGKLTGNATVTQIENSSYGILSYDGTDYSVMPKARFIKAAVEGDVTSPSENQYKLTITDSNIDNYFIENINLPLENFKITNGANRTLHLLCTDHDTVHSVRLDDKAPVANAKGLLEAGDNGGYTVPEGAVNIPLHKGTFEVSIAGGTVTGEKLTDGSGEYKTVTINSASDTIEGTFNETKPEDIGGAVEKTNFDKLRVSSNTKAERLVGGTVLDLNAGNHFFVVADHSLPRSEQVFALSSNSLEGSSAYKMIAAVIRCNTEEYSKNDGIGFTLAESEDPTLRYNVTFYCTAVEDPKSEGTNATIGLKEIDPATYAMKADLGTIDTVKYSESLTEWQPVEFPDLEPGKTYCVYNPGNESENGNIRVFAAEAESYQKQEVSSDWYYNWTDESGDTEGTNITRSGSVVDSQAEIDGNNYTRGFEIGSTTSSNYISFTTVAEGTLTLHMTGGKKIKITNVTDNSYAKPQCAATGILTYSLEAGKEYKIEKESPETYIYYIEVSDQGPAEPAAKYPVTLKGNNSTAGNVTVEVKKGSATVDTFQANSGAFSHEIEGGLEAGEYTLSATGYKFEPSTFTVAEGGNTGTDSIVISESQTVEFPIKIEGAESEVKITVDGRELTFDSDNSYTQNISKEVGANITIAMNSNVANKITGWGENFDPNAYASNKFTETVDRTGFTFTYNKNALTTVDSSKEYPTSASPLDYGNYGYGKKKSTQAGAKIAEDTAELNNVSGVVTLEDYMSGYSDTDQRLIINENAETGVKFKAEGDGTVVIDYSAASNNNIKVTVNSAEQSLSTVPNSTKHKFDVKANDNVEIRSKGTLSRSVQIKSIRYQTDGNVLKLNDNAVSTVDINSLSAATQSALSGDTDTSSTVFARIIGTFNSNDIEPSTVDGVGVMVVPEADLKAKFGNIALAAYYAGLSTGNKGIDLYEDEALYDGVYDGVNDDQQISGSSLNDNIYYMLRHINIKPGNYYLFPYTKVDGVVEFDFADNLSAENTAKYLKEFTKE